ncbi:MAG: hypothetical protein INQ03_22205 [Candidatus Heimdallarchaeota archaeon]|nr:hypothetical protein [Candidatus Heimdallarchaeota archaeon]
MEFISDREARIINKIGDALIPENGEFPKFSDTGCIEHADDLLRYMAPQDLKDLKLLYFVGGIFPKFLFRWVIKLCKQHKYFPAFIATQLRFIDFGVCSLVYTLYYSSKTKVDFKGHKVYDVLDFEVKCERDD